jgi:hypothetical protein
MPSSEGLGTNKWFSIYVPETKVAQTVTTYQSYLRVGGPDTTTEAGFVNALKVSYQDEAAQPAVQAAFGASPTGGIVLYTEGDLVQFVNGRADTRVLNDSYVVHVLNKSDVGKVPAGGATTPAKTYRAYFRLGKENSDVEKPLTGAVRDAELLGFIGVLAPTPESSINTAQKQQFINDVLGGPIPAAGEPPTDAEILKVQTARSNLLSLAKTGDPLAIHALESLRMSGEPQANVTYDGKTAKAWALAALQGVHQTFADRARDGALKGDTAARTRLHNAINPTPPSLPDPLARRKLVELAQSPNPAATQSFNGQTAARDWAAAELAAVSAGKELPARWSLGSGVALYADQPITLTTPSALKITVGSDSRTALGPTYTEAYDVSDDVIQQIKDGYITQAAQIPKKKLITASLTRRERSGLSWRTSKFDQAKTLGYTLSDSGSFGVTHSYAFAAGLKLTNGISGSFDASIGVSASVPSAFKVEVGKKRIETSWSGGKLNYSKDQVLTGSSVKLSVGAVEDFVVWPASEGLALAIRIGMMAVNGLVLAYTATGLGIGDATTGEGEESTKNVREFLDAGEPVYIAVSVLNAVFMAAGLIVGVIQLAARAAGTASQAALPAQPANILMNTAGIKIQCGASYINLDASGVTICGPQVQVVGGITNMIPAYMTGNMTPTQIVEAAQFAEAFGFPMDAFAGL